jgi:single-stranded DNA-specific DHH superfamily exonuclease
VPVAVLVGNHGSARAPEGYNVRDALTAAAESLSRFGGHAAAVGFSVKEGCVDSFKSLFAAACTAQANAGAECDEGEVLIDAWVTPSDISVEFVNSLMRLEPFGEENSEPVFAFKNVYISDVRVMGNDGRHLQLTFSGGLRAVWWNKGELVETLRAKSHLPGDVLFTASISTYGEIHVELKILSIIR